jgi:hypothetical protein
VEAIAADPVCDRQVPWNRVGGRSRRQRGEEGGVEDRDVRDVELRPCRFDAFHSTGIVQRRERNEVSDLIHRRVVQDQGVREVRSAVHDSMPDRPQSGRGKINSGRSQLCRHGLHRLIMISYGTAGLPDPFHQALGQHIGRLGHHELVLQRRRPGVEHQDRRVTHEIA